MSGQGILFSLELWATALEQKAPSRGKRVWAQGRKRVDRLRTAEGGAGLPGITLSRLISDLFPCLNRGLHFRRAVSPRKLSKVQRTEKSEFLYQSGPTGSRESSGSARRSSETRERAAPEAGHAVAGISPASGFLAGAAFRISGPNAAGLRALPRAAPGNQPEVHEALRTHCSRERARAALEVLAAPVSGARARRTPVAFSAPLL